MTFRARVSAVSTLLTSSGWMYARDLSTPTSIVGIDRHGRASRQEVHLVRTTDSAPTVFVGTSHCCGHFAENSILQDIEGKKIRAATLVSEEAIGDLRFEAVVGAGDERDGS